MRKRLKQYKWPKGYSHRTIHFDIWTHQNSYELFSHQNNSEFYLKKQRSESLYHRTIHFDIWCICHKYCKSPNKNFLPKFLQFQNYDYLVFCFLANNVYLLPAYHEFINVGRTQIWVEFSHSKPNKSWVILSDMWHHFQLLAGKQQKNSPETFLKTYYQRSPLRLYWVNFNLNKLLLLHECP